MSNDENKYSAVTGAEEQVDLETVEAYYEPPQQCQATQDSELRARLLDPSKPKTELEWFAIREITNYQEQLIIIAKELRKRLDSEEGKDQLDPLIQKGEDELPNLDDYEVLPPAEDPTHCNYYQHALRELKALGYISLGTPQESGPNSWIQENILELLSVFATQGHSGSSAPYCISLFEKLAKFEPLAPLTGEDSEWAEPEVGMYQNKRCSRVFKDTKGGTAYNIRGKIFREPNGSCYQSRDSRVNIEFPYTPETEYVDVPELKEEEQ